MSDRHPTWELFYAIERDLQAARAKLSTLGTHLSQLDLPDATALPCPVCGIRTRGPRTLAEHLYVAHDGPLPAEWEGLDRLTV